MSDRRLRIIQTKLEGFVLLVYRRIDHGPPGRIVKDLFRIFRLRGKGSIERHRLRSGQPAPFVLRETGPEDPPGGRGKDILAAA